MLACTAMLVGCTSDDVIDNGFDEQKEVKYGNAYISLAITPSSNSSRSEGKNPGDEDGDAEDSKHHNVGTAQENAIKRVLVVLTQGTKNPDPTKPNGVVEYFETPATDFTITGDIRKLNKVYRMATIGKYKAMVVINPVPALNEAIQDLSDPADHNAVYNLIKDFYSGQASYVDSEDKKTYFMMSNKSYIEIDVKEEHNSETNPAGLDNDEIIEVERTISKITYRWKDALTKDLKGENVNSAITALGGNVYEIAVTGKAYNSVTARFWYEDADKNMKYALFNKASLGNTEYWVLFKDNVGELVLNGGQFDTADILGVYTATTELSKGYIGLDETVDVNDDADEKTIYEGGYVTDYVVELATITDLTQLVLAKGTSTDINDQYFVQLEKYQLINLSKSVYAVRHIADINYNEKQFGALGVQDYLVDPFTEGKNKWTSGSTDIDWFEAPYLTVINGATNLATGTELPKALNSNEEADGNGSQDITETQHNDLKTGAFLSYCFENAVAQSQQKFDLVTGIVFQGQMYDKDGNKITKAYSYSDDGGYTKTIYRTLQALVKDNPNLTYTKNGSSISLTENTSDVDAALVNGLEVYNEGKCFYYTAGIKHFDNYNDQQVGVMEYAIMRNNIYSLSIESIKGIGMSTLTPESGDIVEDQSAYITLQAKVTPWIVRFNEIEF